jgi:hypothetical protein
MCALKKAKRDNKKERHAALGDGDFSEDGERITSRMCRAPYP